MNRITVCLIALFLIMGFCAVPIRVHGDYSGNITINSDGSVTPSDAPITSSDNVTYVLFENVNGSINVVKDNIIIDGAGYTLIGTGSIAEKGLDLSSRTNVTIKNMQVTKFYYGIFLSNSTNNTVVKNNMTSNVYGVTLADYSTNNSINENVFVNDGLQIISSYGNTVKDNLVNGKPLTYLEDISNVTVNGNTGQVVLVECNGMTVENLDLSNTSCSIQLVSTNNTRIANNNIMNNRGGIGLWSSSNNQIYKNNITANSIGGIGLGKSSTNNNISENMVEESPIGLELVVSPNNTISENNITASIYTAIENLQSSNTLVSKNKVENSTYGIVFSGSSNNILRENNILDNDNGVLLYNSSNNRICHNNLLDNNQTLTIKYSDPSFLDNGFEGNYWSDYNGTDNNQDGIGDTPHVTDANNTDHYPLMGHFESFNVSTWNQPNDGFEEVDVISNFTISDLGLYVWLTTPNQYLQAGQLFLRIVPVNGQNMTAGFCRMTLPNNILNTSDYIVLTNMTHISVNKLAISNNTHTTLYFTFNISANEEIIIVPEFPSFLILPLFFMATLLTIIFCRKKLTRTA